jgi:hypothetical protein
VSAGDRGESPGWAPSRLDDERSWWLSPWIPWTLVLIGIGLRLVRYLHGRSLWLDEVWLAMAIVERPFRDLWPPLPFEQAAPPGYVGAAWAVTAWLGGGGYALRLLPLLAGALSVALFHLLARRHLGGTTALLAVLGFAISEPLVYYSAEAKPYAVDVLASLAVVYAASRTLRRTPAPAPLLTLAATGAIALWFSFGAAFVTMGTWIVLTIHAGRTGDRPSLLWLGGLGTVWGAMATALYRLSLPSGRSSDYLARFWAHAFAPFPPTSIWDLLWYWNTAMEHASWLLGPPEGGPLAGLVVLLASLGAHQLYHSQRTWLFLLLAPVPLTLAASALHRYPFENRTVLFLFPAVIVLLAEGVGTLLRGDPRRRAIGLAALVLLLPLPALKSVVLAVQGRPKIEIEPVLDQLARQLRPNDVLYVSYGATPAFTYYTRHLGRYDLSRARLVLGHHSRDNWPDGAQRVPVETGGEDDERFRSKNDWVVFYQDLRRLVGQPRVWVLYASAFEVAFEAIDEDKLMQTYVRLLGGRPIEAITAYRVTARLYDLRGTPH